MNAVDSRETLGAEIRARLGGEHGAASALARDCRVTPACIGDIMHARKAPSPAVLSRIADALGVDSATQDRWHAFAGHVAPDVVAALLAAPERWDAVRALLAAEAP